MEALVNSEKDLVAIEKEKIKGAIRTDFILSAEIVVISLGTMRDASIGVQIGALSAIGVLMTVGVYGLVAGIVKLDDLGLWLSQKPGAAARALGAGIVRAAPWLMKGLSIAGTAAMFLVGGGILVHGVPPLHHAIQAWAEGQGSFAAAIVPTLADAVLGIVAGAIVLAGVMLIQKLRGRPA